MATHAWIGLGSNLGDRYGILDAAVAALADAPGVSVETVSSYHETSPVGGPPGQGAFLNAAVSLETTLDPHQLLATLQEIESRAGRVRKVRWGERTLDLDLLIYACKFLETPDLRLPHPRLAFRRFVLAPLAEIAPKIVDTMTKRTISDLLANLETPRGRIAIHGPRGPNKTRIRSRVAQGLGAAEISESETLRHPSSPGDRPGRSYEDLLRRFDVLDSEWCEDSKSLRWVVADFCLPLDLLDLSIRTPGLFEGLNDVRSRKVRCDTIRARLQETRPPTFAVILPEAGEIQRRPGLTHFPLLWPDSTDPDAIADEIVANCRSIDAA
jgi:2-amino-4-hydroxy-6-hydroxymethyldihydropteridine diphosphokinase